MVETGNWLIEYEYDAMNRLIGVRSGDSAILRYAYDPAGNLVAVGPTVADVNSEILHQQTAAEGIPEKENVQWYLNREGQQYGPYSKEQLRQFKLDGNLSGDDLFWHAGLGGWISLTETETML